jgi:hypothetical protein
MFYVIFISIRAKRDVSDVTYEQYAEHYLSILYISLE